MASSVLNKCRGVVLTAFALVALLLTQEQTVWGQLSQERLPVVSRVAPEDAFAVGVDPAAIAFVRNRSVRALYRTTPATWPKTRTEHGLSAFGSMALPFDIHVGAGLELFSLDALLPSGVQRGRGSLALAYAFDDTLAIGGALRWVAREDVADDTRFDASINWRPGGRLGLSVFTRDLFPALGFGSRDRATFGLGALFRPFETKKIQLELEGSVNLDGAIGTRLVALSEWPGVASVRFALDGGDVFGQARVQATIGLHATFGSVSGGVGTTFDERPSIYAALGWDDQARVGVPVLRRAYRVTVASAGRTDWPRALSLVERAAYDANISGVVIDFEVDSVGLALAQEMRLAISAVRAQGRKVVCKFSQPKLSVFYACGGADARYLDVGGGLQITGLASTYFHIKKFLDKIGVKTQIVRIGDYKSYPEQFDRHSMSAAAKAQRVSVKRSLWRRIDSDLRQDIPTETGSLLFADGPYNASQARSRRWVHVLADDTQLPHWAQRTKVIRGYGDRFLSAKKIGVVVIDGSIVDGDNVDLPLLEIHNSGDKTVIAALDRMAADDSIAAIVLRIDSPGGSALASDKIWRAVMRARKQKKVIASLGAVAASGGYYIASAADEIWANPSTITGSIGIFYGKIDLTDLAKTLGLGVDVLKTHPRADFDSWFRPYTDDELELVRTQITHFYQLFLQRVAGRRKMSAAAVNAVGQGRIWTGDQAHKIGLVDHLGGYLSALTRARELANLDDRSGVVFAPGRPEGLLDYILPAGLTGAKDEAERLQTSVSSLLSALHFLVQSQGKAAAWTPIILREY